MEQNTKYPSLKDDNLIFNKFFVYNLLLKSLIVKMCARRDSNPEPSDP